MEEQATQDYSHLLQRLSQSRGSFVNQDNVNDYTYERSYDHPIDKRPIHVFINSVDGRAVHTEDDGTLYTSFGPTVTQDEQAPRERGELTDSLKQIIQVRGGDEGRLEVLDRQPAPAQEFIAPTTEVIEQSFDTDQMMVTETEAATEAEPEPTTQQTDSPPTPATPS